MSKHTLCRLWFIGTALWITGCSIVTYRAYQEPYDLWLVLDPAHVQYKTCWPSPQTTTTLMPTTMTPGRHDVEFEAPWQGAARIRRVATCYRAINRLQQTTSRTDVLKHGVVTMAVVPMFALFVLATWQLLSARREP